jgi:hypothetical protein
VSGKSKGEKERKRGRKQLTKPREFVSESFSGIVIKFHKRPIVEFSKLHKYYVYKLISCFLSRFVYKSTRKVINKIVSIVLNELRDLQEPVRVAVEIWRSMKRCQCSKAGD